MTKRKRWAMSEYLDRAARASTDFAPADQCARLDETTCYCDRYEQKKGQGR